MAFKKLAIVGVTKVGAFPNTRNPEPVSSEISVANCAEVVDANWLSPVPVTPHVGQEMVPVEVIGPPRIGDVVEIVNPAQSAPVPLTTPLEFA